MSLRHIIPATDSLRVFINSNSLKRSCILLQSLLSWGGGVGVGRDRSETRNRGWELKGRSVTEERKPEAASGILVDRFALKSLLPALG